MRSNSCPYSHVFRFESVLCNARDACFSRFFPSCLFAYFCIRWARQLASELRPSLWQHPSSWGCLDPAQWLPCFKVKPSCMELLLYEHCVQLVLIIWPLTASGSLCVSINHDAFWRFHRRCSFTTKKTSHSTAAKRGRAVFDDCQQEGFGFVVLEYCNAVGMGLAQSQTFGLAMRP